MNRRLVISLVAFGMLPCMAIAGQEGKNTKETMKVEITDTCQIEEINNIAYSQILSSRSDHQLLMSILVPRTRELKPAIVFYPGGGFISADHGHYPEMRMALAKAGFVVASAEYRTVPDMYPALVVDAKTAVRFLRAHAQELGIDPTRIGVIGDSAGGYVAQMVGTTNGEKGFDQGDYLDQSSDVQAAATMYGISNLMNIGEGHSEEIQKIHASPAVTEALLVNGCAFFTHPGASILSNPQKSLDASPMGHVKENMPPFLVMHGDADPLVSPIQSEQLYKALTEKGNKVDYVVIEGAGHGDYYWYQKPVVEKIVNWFKKTLKNE